MLAENILTALRPDPRRLLFNLLQEELKHRQREAVADELARFIVVAKVSTLTADELEMLLAAHGWLAPGLFNANENAPAVNQGV